MRGRRSSLAEAVHLEPVGVGARVESQSLHCLVVAGDPRIADVEGAQLLVVRGMDEAVLPGVVEVLCVREPHSVERVREYRIPI